MEQRMEELKNICKPMRVVVKPQAKRLIEKNLKEMQDRSRYEIKTKRIENRMTEKKRTSSCT